MLKYIFSSLILIFSLYSCNKDKDKTGANTYSDYSVYESSKGLHGYISYNSTKPPLDYGAGISFYSAVWPLIDKPLANFQIGLPGTWIIPENSDVDFPLCPEGTYARDNWAPRGPTWASVFQTIEGGLGYWAGNHFRYGSPKFSMNATSSCYDFEIASPGWDFFRHSEPLDDDKMGIAQLSNCLLVPPDGITFDGKPNGEFLGYAWMALPFTEAVDGLPPTGDQSWTLFLNSNNFKGPVAYYIPETWSKISRDYEPDYGRGLDARPGVMGGGAMEINTVPKMYAKNEGDTVFYKIPQLYFPIDEQGRSMLVQDVKYYSKDALYYDFKAWLDGGEICKGNFGESGSWEPELTTSMPAFDQGGIKLVGVNNYFSTNIFDGRVFGIDWNVSDTDHGKFPQYYMQVGKGARRVVSEDIVPDVLREKEFKLAERGAPYTSPNSGSWSDPGPASDPVTVTLADGSSVTYTWYRFIDQPSLQQFNWSNEKRERLQRIVEMIHDNWLNNKTYMTPPGRGELVDLDPALLVQPPVGFESGYVPIVTGQR